MRTDTDLKPLEHALYTAMSDVSETLYAAGWMKDAEHDIWRLMREGGTWGMGCACTVADALAAIKALSEQTGTWIVWNDGPEAVPLERWALRYGARMDARAHAYREYVATGGPERSRELRRSLFGDDFEGIAWGCERCQQTDDDRHRRWLS